MRSDFHWGRIFIASRISLRCSARLFQASKWPHRPHMHPIHRPLLALSMHWHRNRSVTCLRRRRIWLTAHQHRTQNYFTFREFSKAKFCQASENRCFGRPSSLKYVQFVETQTLWSVWNMCCGFPYIMPWIIDALNGLTDGAGNAEPLPEDMQSVRCLNCMPFVSILIFTSWIFKFFLFVFTFDGLSHTTVMQWKGELSRLKAINHIGFWGFEPFGRPFRGDCWMTNWKPSDCISMWRRMILRVLHHSAGFISIVLNHVQPPQAKLRFLRGHRMLNSRFMRDFFTVSFSMLNIYHIPFVHVMEL